MAHIEPKHSLIKAALLGGLRVGVFFTHDETLVEYHFIKDPRDPKDFLNNVVCVMCTSTTSDPLRLSGVVQPIKEFMRTFDKPVMYANYTTPYQRTGVKLYPGDWYPCFETNKEKRIDQVKKMLPSLEPVSIRIAKEDEKALEDERKRQEDERKHREELRRIDEERRKERLQRAPMFQSRIRQYTSDIRRSPHPVGLADLTDEDISEILAKGFLTR